MAAATAVLDANLFLIDPVGNEIAANDDANPALLGTACRTTDAIISGFELPVNGPYTHHRHALRNALRRHDRQLFADAGTRLGRRAIDDYPNLYKAARPC